MYHPEIETASRGEMAKIQLERLKATVEKVYNNTPFYKELFDQLGVKPSNIQSLEDIRKLPFTKK